MNVTENVETFISACIAVIVDGIADFTWWIGGGAFIFTAVKWIHVGVDLAIRACRHNTSAVYAARLSTRCFADCVATTTVLGVSANIIPFVRCPIAIIVSEVADLDSTVARLAGEFTPIRSSPSAFENRRHS